MYPDPRETPQVDEQSTSKGKAKTSKAKTYRAVRGVNLPPNDDRYEPGDTIALSSPGPVERAAIAALAASGDIEEID